MRSTKVETKIDPRVEANRMSKDLAYDLVNNKYGRLRTGIITYEYMSRYLKPGEVLVVVAGYNKHNCSATPIRTDNADSMVRIYQSHLRGAFAYFEVFTVDENLVTF